ncbi:hypothetical protein [Rosistilla oblonga]|uniref:hypothetical protein n=1 Tax=Rosistilla oblonga TaxID=2527990 RepID=UPI003A97A3B1
MVRSILLSVCCIFALCIVSGCEKSNSTRSVPTSTISPADQIKSALQITIDSGAPGSEIVTIEENVDKLEGGKSGELKADLEELKGLQGAKAVSKAKEMMGKL